MSNEARKYEGEDYKFNPALVEMFADTVISSTDLYEVMLTFLKLRKNNTPITIKNIVDSAIVKRRVAATKGKRIVYEESETNMAKGAVIKAVEQLEKMQLIYSEAIGRTFTYHFSIRGDQISKEVMKHYVQRKQSLAPKQPFSTTAQAAPHAHITSHQEQ